MSSTPSISLVPLHEDDREQFILDLQWAFRYGAQIEFGMRDDRTEEVRKSFRAPPSSGASMANVPKPTALFSMADSWAE